MNLTTNHILGRVIAAAIPVGAIVALGVLLQTANLFSWVITFAIVTAVTFFRNRNLGPELSGMADRDIPDDRPFARLMRAVARAPWVRRIDTNKGARLLISLILGALVATMVPIVATTMLGGLDETSGSLVAMSLVLAIVYFTEERVRAAYNHQPPPWVQEIVDALWGLIRRLIHRLTLLETKPIKFGPNASAASWALLRATVSVVGKAFAIWLLPTVFSDPVAIIFVALVLLSLIIWLETISKWWKTNVLRPQPSADIPDVSSSRQDSQLGER
ncbi:MAG: hypothetical protein WED09_05470 [Homoserinimonas sp.]